MRYLLAVEIVSAFRRGVSVEQFLGQSPVDAGHIRHVELRPSEGKIEIWVHDVEDIGNDEYLDLYDFPCLNSNSPKVPVATFSDPQVAIAYASTLLAADQDRWVNQGVVQSEYVDFIRAGKPSRWPVSN